MSSGDTAPRKPQRSKLWWEIRITAAGLALLVMAIGGYQLWKIALEPLTARLVIEGEIDPSTDVESTAEWLVRRLEFEVRLTDNNTTLLSLPAGTLDGELRVKGRQQRREVEAGAVMVVARLPGAERSEFELALRPTLLEDGGMRCVLGREEARAYCRRNVSAYVVVRDQREAAVRGVTSVGRIPIRERRDEPGAYDVQVPLENLIFVLEGDGSYPVEVRAPDGSQSTLEVPGEWFLREGQRSRVLTLALAPAAPTALSPTPPPQPPVEKPRPSTPAGAQETAEVDVAQLQRQQAALERDIEGALGRQQWDRAEAQIDALAEMTGPTERIAGLRRQLTTGRDEEGRQEQLQQAGDEVGAALLARDWDRAEAAVDRVRALDAQDARLATWREAIDAGRATDALAATPSTAGEAGAAPTPEPAVDEQALIRAALARYVESQNTLDWDLFVAVMPSAKDSRTQVQRAWNGYRSQAVVLDVQSVRVDGGTAVAQCYRSISVVPKVGGAQRNEGRCEFGLSKASGTWIIDRITPLP